MKNNLIIRRPFRYTFFHATLALIIINFLVFILAYQNPRLNIYLSLNVRTIMFGKMYWQFITYMFAHQGFQHLFFNMLALFIFGIAVERAIGSKEFLLFYFVTGLLVGLFSFVLFWVTKNYNAFLLGASGAVYAILFAYATCFPRNIISIWGIIPIPAPILVLIYTIIEIVSQVFSSSNVAHFAHLFGFFAAFLYFIIRMGINPIKIWKRDYLD